MDYVTLVGAENVRNASHTIQSAADSLRQTGGYLDETVRQFRVAVEQLDIVLTRDRQEREVARNREELRQRREKGVSAR